MSYSLEANFYVTCFAFDSNDNQASKVSKTDESQKTENTQGDQSHANISYNANGVASSTTSAYSYNPGVANQWGAYAAATQNVSNLTHYW